MAFRFEHRGVQGFAVPRSCEICFRSRVTVWCCFFVWLRNWWVGGGQGERGMRGRRCAAGTERGVGAQFDSILPFADIAGLQGMLPTISAPRMQNAGFVVRLRLAFLALLPLRRKGRELECKNQISQGRVSLACPREFPARCLGHIVPEAIRGFWYSGEMQCRHLPAGLPALPSRPITHSRIPVQQITKPSGHLVNAERAIDSGSRLTHGTS